MEELIGFLASDTSSWSWLGDQAYYVICMLLGLGFVIFVHELGHFLVAKACGVKCEKFYIGFDVPMPFGLPSALFRKKWGETEYGIGILPLGGYVKMLGQDDNPNNAEAEAERIRSGGQLDPRSYPAKSVPQRMAIISAGVIMNLIFAVVLGAIAYGMGVRYTPSVIGAVAAGSPAWEKGLQPGDQVLQLGEDDGPREHLRFDKDLMVKLFFHGYEKPLAVTVRRPDGETETLNVQPTALDTGKRKRAILGVTAAGSTDLAKRAPIVPGFPAASEKPGFEPGDRIVAIDGQKVQTSADVLQAIAARPADALRVTVERAAKDDAETAGANSARRVEIAVPPTPRQSFGMVVNMGPIVSVREKSPAAVAGVQKGDVLLRVAGEPVGDPVTLPERMLAHVGQTIDLELRRGEKTVTVTATPERPMKYQPDLGSETPVAIESLGLAYRVGAKVEEIEPGSPAERAGLEVGDKLVRVAFEPIEAKEDDPASQVEADMLLGLGEPLELTDSGAHWAFVASRINFVPKARIKISYDRGEKRLTTDWMRAAASSQHHFTDRGFRFQELERIHKADSFGEAVSLGYRETKEQFLQVLTVLYRLVSGGVSVSDLGGPASIVVAASSEASKGVPRLLIFLTFLSANLAIVNFLPIPALDGGHMMFLLWEAIWGKPLNEQMMIRLTLGGVAFLLGLIIFVTYNDVGRIVDLFSR